SFGRARARPCLGSHRAAGGDVDRLGRGDRLQPRHPRRAATRPHHRLHGQRGDRRPPSSEKFYPEIDTAITRATGKPSDQTVVMTADYSFLSYYPYFGFQGLTSHYANPLAQFDKRAAAIKSWSKLKAADPFIHALDTLPWAPPTVFLMRHGGSAGESSTYTLRLAEDA